MPDTIGALLEAAKQRTLAGAPVQYTVSWGHQIHPEGRSPTRFEGRGTALQCTPDATDPAKPQTTAIV